MKLRTKVVGVIASAALLVSASIFGTMAYLTSTTGEVKNTFTVGKVAITLDELDVDSMGNPTTPSKRDMANEYKLMPGHTYVKDPTVHVSESSEEAYLFVKVVDEISAIEDTTTVAKQMESKGWSKVDGTENIYVLDHTVKGSDANKDIVVFENFTVKGDVTNEQLNAYENKTITVTAYAVQKDGFDTAKEAWTTAELDQAK